MNDKELIVYNNEPSTAQLLEGEIIFYQASENIRIEVRLVDETVWLTQQQMAELFNKDRTDIGRHIRNIYKEGELEKNITCAKFAHMGTEGDQKYEYTAYNLDVIISVGYRVKSKRGTKFRQWANKVLKEYLLRGYAINTRIVALERHAAIQDDAIHELQNKVDFFIHTSLPPVEGIFYDGQVFDAYTFVADLIRSAQNQIILIDNYVDDSVLKTLTKRKESVSAIIITRKISETLRIDLDRHNQQYSPVDISTSDRYHDRFLIVDKTVYHLGASLKDLGKKLFAFNRMEISAEEILSFST